MVTGPWEHRHVDHVDVGSQRARSFAGASATARWKSERRSLRRRRALAVLLAGVALLAGAAAVLGDGGGPLGTSAGLPRRLLVATALVSAVGAMVAARQGADPGRWARGAAGELGTAALLERLPRRRWVVLHDLRLPASKANVDHLVIGPTGVWVVDSKAYRAPLQAHWHKVLVGGAGGAGGVGGVGGVGALGALGGASRVGGVALDTSPVRWEAEVVSRLLGVHARPVVAVHGQGLPARGRRCGGVRVLPAARAVRRLKRRPLWRRKLSPGAVRVGERAATLLPSYALVGRSGHGAARHG